jgi:AcrR family transcriptional regulator
MSSPDHTPVARSAAPKRGRPRGVPRRSREERRKELLDAAERAIRRIGPLASMEDLAAEAGITKPILYSHFGDRAGLAKALADRSGDQLIANLSDAMSAAALTREPREVVRAALGTFCSFVEAEPAIYRFVVLCSFFETSHPVTSNIANGVAEKIAQVLENGLRAAGADPDGAEAWAIAVVGMTFVCAEWWLERHPMSMDKLVGYLTQIVWGGLAGVGLERLQPADLDPAGVVTPLVPHKD